jgi:hypothetical protein
MQVLPVCATSHSAPCFLCAQLLLHGCILLLFTEDNCRPCRQPPARGMGRPGGCNPLGW